VAFQPKSRLLAAKDRTCFLLAVTLGMVHTCVREHKMLRATCVPWLCEVQERGDPSQSFTAYCYLNLEEEVQNQ